MADCNRDPGTEGTSLLLNPMNNNNTNSYEILQLRRATMCQGPVWCKTTTSQTWTSVPSQGYHRKFASGWLEDKTRQERSGLYLSQSLDRRFGMSVAVPIQIPFWTWGIRYFCGCTRTDPILSLGKSYPPSSQPASLFFFSFFFFFFALPYHHPLQGTLHHSSRSDRKSCIRIGQTYSTLCTASQSPRRCPPSRQPCVSPVVARITVLKHSDVCRWSSDTYRMSLL